MQSVLTTPNPSAETLQIAQRDSGGLSAVFSMRGRPPWRVAWAAGAPIACGSGDLVDIDIQGVEVEVIETSEVVSRPLR
jgi:hypothetical protein